MREITTIVVHGAWTKAGVHVSAETIRKWHTDPKEEDGRGWSDIGYHEVIERDGTYKPGRPIERKGAHVAGHNDDTIGICLVGGRSDDTPKTVGLLEFEKQEVLWEFNYTAAQMATLVKRVEHHKAQPYGENIKDVCGHRDFPGVKKRCPGFEVRAFFGD